jgi:hypothetical protein
MAYVLSFYMGKDIFDNPNNVAFNKLLALCRSYFGEPRISGSHHIFKTPWQGDPRVNLQKDGKMAKPYQVQQVLRAIEKLEKKDGK